MRCARMTWKRPISGLGLILALVCQISLCRRCSVAAGPSAHEEDPGRDFIKLDCSHSHNAQFPLLVIPEVGQLLNSVCLLRLYGTP